MIQVGFINTEGEIISWSSPGSDFLYTEGDTVNGMLVRHFPYNLDINEYRKYNVWNGSSWSSRTWKDSSYHKWESGAWVYKSVDFLNAVRGVRDGKLYVCDWTQMGDSPLTDAQKASYVTYRQQLRDFPGTLDLSSEPTDVQSLSWPTEPTI